jgi:hypothetical protein
MTLISDVSLLGLKAKNAMAFAANTGAVSMGTKVSVGGTGVAVTGMGVLVDETGVAPAAMGVIGAVGAQLTSKKEMVTIIRIRRERVNMFFP